MVAEQVPGATRSGARESESVILTPDQRVRVFVSSTMGELADERAAVQRAVEALRLAPVLFELGARAHPPRSLYRAYLDQSHVFLGIYWERYGWIAPGMEVSGLEDEYLLSGKKPKLVYVKRPSDRREERLVGLLDRVRDDDQVSYKSFTDAAELERLVSDDLAHLLSEAFMVTPTRESSSPRVTSLPADVSSFVGRTEELAEIDALLRRDDVRLVTITGPGGIGKTRLGLRAGAAAASAFDDGAVFVALAAVRDHRLVAGAIATALDLGDFGPSFSIEALRDHLAGRSVLIVLDNFEHLLGAADVVADLLSAAPRLKLLVTSREALRLRAEYEFPAPPLTPAEGATLFGERAAAVRHGFALDESNSDTILRICRRLEGVPLAIELAAARSRLLPPEALLERLDHRLDALVGGARDLPERQRTLRATIEWSYDLLNEEERRLFDCCGVFVGSFSLTAVEAVGAIATSSETLDLVASLVDKSLVRVEPIASEPRFHMLEMIGEFARERLGTSDLAERIGECHALFYRDLSFLISDGVEGSDQLHWLQMLTPNGDGDNMRAAIEWCFRRSRIDDVADMAWALIWPAWIGGRLEEARRVGLAALASPGELSGPRRGRLLAGTALFVFWMGDRESAERMLNEALEISDSIDDGNELRAFTLLGLSMIDPFEIEGRAEQLARQCIELSEQRADDYLVALAYNLLCVIRIRLQQLDGEADLFEEALAKADARGDGHVAVMAEGNLAAFRLAHGDADGAARVLVSSVRRERALPLKFAVQYLLEASAWLAWFRSDNELATVLLGAVTRQRHLMGVYDWGKGFGRRALLIEALQTALTPEGYDEAFNRGRLLGFSATIDAAAQATELTGAQ